MPTFAAVDIGANSVRLKIARLVEQRLEMMHEDREVTRLGDSVFRSGLLSSDAMAQTMRVLRRFHKAAQSYGANAVRVVATSSLREARNRRVFTDWVRSTTGWRVEVISGLEEGRLIHLALTANRRRAASSRMLWFDLGGGSCEITTSVDGWIRAMISLPLGAVRLTREFLKHDPPKQTELRRLHEFIQKELGRLEKRAATADVLTAIATSGTAAALAAVYSSRVNRKSATVPRSAVLRLAAELAQCDIARRRTLRGIGTRRAEIIVAGAMVFAELLTRFELPSFRYSPLGLRDGVLAQMAAEYDRNTGFQKQIESQRGEALLTLGKRFGVDIRFAERVRDLAVKLFGALKKVHQLPREYQDWLVAAAMLHELGTYINRAGRRRHTYYIISHSEIFGYTVHQREIIATIARYLGRSHATPRARPMLPLTTEERALVPKAVMLLRLARALEQSRHGAVVDVKVRVQEERVTLHLAAKHGAADLELWALGKERNYFREVFGRTLSATILS
jgi:exopolyphosphatase / guanosine-5'-triphosphate,3'-diphosphate pyrophosphatase